MSQLAGKNLLEQIVGSYLGAVIQREHIKNKRLDDIVTTAGNYAQQNLQASLERVNQKMGASLDVNGVAIGPTVEYGETQRQLGVTPFPAPPTTINVNDEKHNFEDNTTNKTSPTPPSPPPSQAAPPTPSKEDVSFQESGKAVETKKAGFPWMKTLAGTALAASVATNGYLLYKSNTSPTVLPPQFPPANNTDIWMDSGMGSVSIGVE